MVKLVYVAAYMARSAQRVRQMVWKGIPAQCTSLQCMYFSGQDHFVGRGFQSILHVHVDTHDDTLPQIRFSPMACHQHAHDARFFTSIFRCLDKGCQLIEELEPRVVVHSKLPVDAFRIILEAAKYCHETWAIGSHREGIRTRLRIDEEYIVRTS